MPKKNVSLHDNYTPLPLANEKLRAGASAGTGTQESFKLVIK
jgi:hypothetical protein